MDVKQPRFAPEARVRTKPGLRTRGKFAAIQRGIVESSSYPYSNKTVVFYTLRDAKGKLWFAHESDLMEDAGVPS